MPRKKTRLPKTDLARRLTLALSDREPLEVAVQARISKTAIYNYMAGDRAPRSAILHRLASVCGVSLEWLLATSDQIRDEFGPIVQVVGADSLGEAVQIAYGLAPHGGTVLLSPACSSLDMFQDYAERGRTFKRAVARLREEVGGTREQ